MQHKLISVALIIILLFMFVGNIIACAPTTTRYDLIINSTAGGSVTTPGEGTFTYDVGMVVNLVATPDSGYKFVNWTGNVGTIANINAASTTITVSGDYSITANFEAIPAIKHDLTITSTEGGTVTTPGEGTFPYDAGEVVNLVATPDPGYRFVKWTGDVGTVANVNATTTTITMNGNYTITANFALGTLIAGVPDTNQPPTVTLATTVPNNYCAPIAMINIVYYWDVVKGHPNAQNLNAGLPAITAAEYLGYFMDTNDSGSPARPAGVHMGTRDPDIGPGTMDFVRWDAMNIPPPGPPPFPLPDAKNGYVWMVTPDIATGFNVYKAEIDAGRPLVVTFNYWNPVSTQIVYNDPETGEAIHVFTWGGQLPGSSPPNPEEYWSQDIGHAVTGVGYILNWDPDGPGPLGSATYVIVHDNWATTPKNIAIPWANWKSSNAINPGS